LGRNQKTFQKVSGEDLGPRRKTAGKDVRTVVERPMSHVLVERPMSHVPVAAEPRWDKDKGAA
jgi:hypothetical protein